MKQVAERSVHVVLVGILYFASQCSCLGDGVGSESHRHIEATVKKFMETYDVPGLSIAFSKNGRILFARGFGFADEESQTSVTPSHRFRIASVSKPITSIAIHTLIQRRKLAYSSRVFGEGAVLEAEYGEKPYSEQLKRITVEHLLTHTAGGWDNKDNDPMFMKIGLDHGDLISWTLDNQPLENEPGTEYAYSNFGYCLLGRIIERVTGQTYEEYVTKTILAPIDADSIRIAGNLASDRLPNEVTYYAANENAPYGMNVSRMDAHGGWVATPSDLVSLVSHYDGFRRPRDRLSASAIRHMVTPSTANASYAKGWSVNEANNWWHIGSLPGTGAIAVRASNGYCWAVLVNSRSSIEGFFGALDKLPWNILHGVKQWPNGAAR